jgi:hypothetical protein
MAANTNPTQSRPPRNPPTISLTKKEVEQLMLDIIDPLDIKRYEESSPSIKERKRRLFRQLLRACVEVFPRIESTTGRLNAFLGHFQVALGPDESLAQDAALIATSMRTESGTTWVSDVNPIVESTFSGIVMLSRLPSVQNWAHQRNRTLKVPEQWRQIIELAKVFLETLRPVMDYAVSGTGRAVPPPYRLLRAILIMQPFMALNSPGKHRLNRLMSTLVDPIHNWLDIMTCEDRLSNKLKEDIKTIEFLLRIPQFGDDATRKECEIVIQTWNSQRNLESMRRPCCCSLCKASGPEMNTLQNTGGMEETGGGPTPCRNTSPLPLPSNALPQGESTVATPRAFTSTASAPALGSGTSSQSMLYPENTTAPQRCPGAAYLPSQSNAMPQMATTMPAPAPPFANIHPAMEMSAMGVSATDMPATGTSSRPRPLTQSMPNPSHTTTDLEVGTLDDLAPSNTEMPLPYSDTAMRNLGDMAAEELEDMTLEEMTVMLYDDY